MSFHLPSAMWPYFALFGLGVYHGINPGMGWLFAVALALQARDARALWRALLPIAVGHAASIAMVLLTLSLGQFTLPARPLTWLCGGLLVAFGVLKLWRPRHPRWVGMQVGFRDLVLWSFLMATAHGAGLMLLPVFLLGQEGMLQASEPCHGPASTCHTVPGLPLWSAPGYLLAVGVHTGAMLLAAGAVAALVYYKLGLTVLTRSWIDLDRIWAVALILAGLLAFLYGATAA